MRKTKILFMTSYNLFAPSVSSDLPLTKLRGGVLVCLISDPVILSIRIGEKH